MRRRLRNGHECTINYSPLRQKSNPDRGEEIAVGAEGVGGQCRVGVSKGGGNGVRESKRCRKMTGKGVDLKVCEEEGMRGCG